MSVQVHEKNKEREDNSKLDDLIKLKNRSVGSWVECYCTKVEADELEFTFETLHDYKTIKKFEIPKKFEGSDVEEFLDRVGYSPENANLMEGEKFWINTEDDTIQKELPLFSKLRLNRLYSESLKNIFSQDWLHYIGFSLVFPIWGYKYYKFVQSNDSFDEENEVGAVFGTLILFLLWLMMILFILDGINN